MKSDVLDNLEKPIYASFFIAFAMTFLFYTVYIIGGVFYKIIPFSLVSYVVMIIVCNYILQKISTRNDMLSKSIAISSLIIPLFSILLLVLGKFVGSFNQETQFITLEIGGPLVIVVASFLSAILEFRNSKSKISFIAILAKTFLFYLIVSILVVIVSIIPIVFLNPI